MRMGGTIMRVGGMVLGSVTIMRVGGMFVEDLANQTTGFWCLVEPHPSLMISGTPILTHPHVDICIVVCFNIKKCLASLVLLNTTQIATEQLEVGGAVESTMPPDYGMYSVRLKVNI